MSTKLCGDPREVNYFRREERALVLVCCETGSPQTSIEYGGLAQACRSEHRESMAARRRMHAYRARSLGDASMHCRMQ
jgi:hypothetical protein